MTKKQLIIGIILIPTLTMGFIYSKRLPNEPKLIINKAIQEIEVDSFSINPAFRLYSEDDPEYQDAQDYLEITYHEGNYEFRDNLFDSIIFEGTWYELRGRLIGSDYSCKTLTQYDEKGKWQTIDEDCTYREKIKD